MKNKLLRLLGGSAGLGVIVWSAAAHAEPSTALDHLIPAPSGDRFLAVPSAAVSDETRTTFAFLGSWAQSPLRLSIRSASGATREVQIVSHQAIVHALASLEFLRRYKLEVNAPLIVSQGGEAATTAQFSTEKPSGAGAGDLRIGGRVEIFEGRGHTPSVAVAMSLWLPTSNPGPFNGSEGVRFAPALVVGADHPSYVWSVSLARRFQETTAIQRSDMVASAAAAARLGPVQLGPEFWLSQATASVNGGLSVSDFGGELLLAARYLTGPFAVSLAGGPGMGTAPGVPLYRVLAGFAYAPEPVFREERSRRRRLPEGEAGDPRGLPGDGRGGPGGEARDPRQPPGSAPAVSPPPAPALAPDQDGDGVADSVDRCPAEAGVATLDAATNGCPPDRDGDGISDSRDACPNEKGDPSESPRDHGCPRAVRVQGEQIVIMQQVTFKLGSDVIDASSFGLLQQVTDVIAQRPDVARVAIEGHTDNVGLERTNVDLSRRRAAAVMRWMTEHGIDARRLEARGFGPKRPIADNKTEDGRARNRRVEFLIVKRTAQGEAGWQEGSAKP